MPNRGQSSYINAFERYVLELAERMTIQDVAEHLGISWDVVKEIVKSDLKRNFAKPALEGLAADGHRRDFDRVGAPLFDARVGLGQRSRGACRPRKRRRRLDCFFDRFHVIKLLNEALSDLRRAMYREVTDKMGKKVLKGTRWLLLKRPENLDPKHDEEKRLQEALRLNAPLAAAYYLKEELYEFWEQEDYDEAEAFLLDWIERAEATHISHLVKFARTLRGHWSGLLNYYDYPISNGPLEGTNNKIKTMQRQAYGYRDQEFFQLKIYALHKARYALVG